MTIVLKRAGRSVRVFRLIKHIPDHFPTGATKPIPGAFRLTQDDIDDGIQRGIPPLFSVWNHAKTNVSEALRIRRARDGYSPFQWSVGAIEDIRVQGVDSLTVYEDPLPRRDGSGARGHCGIAGLVPDHRQAKGREKEAYRALQVALCDSCAPLTDKPSRPLRPTVQIIAIAAVAIIVAGTAIRLASCQLQAITP